MVCLRTGLFESVYYTALSYRIMLPFGKCLSKSSFFVLLGYDKKMLVNTGVIENQNDLERVLSSAGSSYSDLDYVVNMSYRPEHIGLNSIIQFHNKKVRFFAPFPDIGYIEDTVLQHEERYVPGFYRLVSGNTEGVESLEDGQVFDLGEEKVIVSGFSYDNDLCLTINNSGIKIY